MVQLDDKVTLHCRATGSPAPMVSWIVPGSMNHQNPALSATSYTIEKVTREDKGRYVCVADNRVGGQSSQDLYLKVQCKYNIQS